MIYYIQGKKPIPTDRIEKWEVNDNIAKIWFEKKAFKDGTTYLEFVYDTHDDAIKDLNWMWEGMNK